MFAPSGRDGNPLADDGKPNGNEKTNESKQGGHARKGQEKMKTQTVITIPSELAESSEKMHELGGPREDYTVADAVKDTVMMYDHVIFPYGEISGSDFERLLRNVYAPSARLDYACAACAWIEKIERTGFGVKCSPVFEPWKMELLKVSDYGKSWRAAK